MIFVVDDDSLVLKLIETELGATGLKIRSFHFGEECLKHLNLHPDLVILDYIFFREGDEPMNGLEILHEIRKMETKIPVIILSAQESGSIVLELMKEGIEDYIIKESNFTAKLRTSVTEILHLD